MNTRPSVAPYQPSGRLLTLQDAAEGSTLSGRVLLVCLIANWLTLEKEQRGQVSELPTSLASSARVSMLRVSERTPANWPCPTYSSAGCWKTQLEMLSTEPPSPFETLGHPTGTGLSSCRLQKGHLKLHQMNSCPTCYWDTTQKSFGQKMLLVRQHLSCGHLLLWHFFTLSGWLSLFQKLRKNRSY